MILRNFVVQEFVPPEIYSLRGDKAVDLMQPSIILTAIAIREKSGLCVRVNNWHLGGSLRYRGYRPHGCGVGAPKGMHYTGGALDFDIGDWDAERSRKWILDNAVYFPLIRRMETGVPWVHVDIKETGRAGIVLFRP